MSEPKETTVAVIGTSGRKDDEIKLNANLYQKMIVRVEEIIEKTFKLDWDNVVLYSGGAAYADHVAVALFLKYSPSKKIKLVIETPCGWDFDRCQFSDNGGYGWQQNPGWTLNKYHTAFSKKCKLHSLDDIYSAIMKGAQVIVSNGFFDRNLKVAKAERMIALTFGVGKPKDGGTGHTWGHSKLESEHKIHVCLGTL